ncbi:MAG: retroviral-like aspartic protease family protein [Planctomycetales bacterium]
MEIITTGKVVVPARIENLRDVYFAERQLIAPSEIRGIEVEDAVVDTGATLLSLPRRLVAQLGLERRRTRTARTAAGVFEFGIYDPVRLTVQDRDCLVEVSEIPDDCPVLIGQVPLEILDFVVDPIGQRLLGNPDHGGEQMIDLF